MPQFQPFAVESFESGPELYLAVLRKTPHRASEIVRYLRGTVRAGRGRLYRLDVVGGVALLILAVREAASRKGRREQGAQELALPACEFIS